MWSDHKRLEERSLALHREVAERIQANPALVQVAERNLGNWIRQHGQIPVWREWKEILGKPLAEIMELLVSDDENARRLRQSSPFCGILTPRERWRIYESFTVGAYYQGSGEYSERP